MNTHNKSMPFLNKPDALHCVWFKIITKGGKNNKKTSEILIDLYFGIYSYYLN